MLNNRRVNKLHISSQWSIQMPLKRIFANSYIIHGKITLSLMLKEDSDVKLHNKCDTNLDKCNFTNEDNNNDVESVMKQVHL